MPARHLSQDDVSDGEKVQGARSGHEPHSRAGGVAACGSGAGDGGEVSCWGAGGGAALRPSSAIPDLGGDAGDQRGEGAQAELLRGIREAGGEVSTGVGGAGMGWIGSPGCQPESREGKRDADASARSHVLDPSFAWLLRPNPYPHANAARRGVARSTTRCIRLYRKIDSNVRWEYGIQGAAPCVARRVVSVGRPLGCRPRFGLTLHPLCQHNPAGLLDPASLHS